MKIERIDAAQRLLDTAIRLWLETHDPLAVHALTMSAFRVLFDLHKHVNQEQSQLLEKVFCEIGSVRLYEVWNKLKHADRDPMEVVSIPPDSENEWRIGLTLVMYRMLKNDLTPEMGAFHLMSLAAYPDQFEIDADEDPDIEAGAQMGAEHLRKNSEQRREFVRTHIKLILEGKISANVSLRRRIM